MKHIKILHLSTVSLLILMAAFFGACKKDSNQGLESPRLFKPSAITIKTDATSAKITWTSPLLSTGQKLTYTTQFSQDSTFANYEFSINTDTAGVTISDDKIKIRKKYFVRVKANAYEDQPESKWIISSGFTITGEQLFLPIRDVELKETSVTLRFKPTTGLSSIVLTPASGNAITINLTSTDASAGIKVITGITAGTAFSAELFLGSKSEGLLLFTTPPATLYAKILNSGDDLAAAISTAANNDVIGLNPGVYSSTTNFTVLQKTITIKSTSGNPADTKVNFKEFTIRGSGAGLILSGIEFDGTTANAGYFLNLTGAAADAEICNFTQLTIDNCIVHGVATSMLRANRGANAGDYKIDQITVKNSVIYDIASALGYYCFHLDKLQFNTLNVTKSTFYNFGQGLLTDGTVINATLPSITFDYCTFNNFGGNNKYALVDANSNPAKINITNSIIANSPRPNGTTQAASIRANGAGSAIVFNNNNVFNFTNGSGAALTLPTSNITQVGNLAVNLNWNTATTTFTLPQDSPLRTASNVSIAIGDPRWTY